MDEHTLDSLVTALEVTPNNVKLRLLVIEALRERRDKRLDEMLAGIDPELISDAADQLTYARALFESGRAQEALAACPANDQGKLLQVKIYIRLGRRDEAKALYLPLLAQNASLESEELNRELALEEVEPVESKTERPKLRVISNDNTDVTEINRLMAPAIKTVSFKDVGGLAEVKKQIHKKIILPFQKPGLFQRFRKRVGGGILLYGPPGCGKTLMARATAGECNARFINVELSDVLDMYIGESERKLHALFDLARGNTPSVLFFDEVEALGGKRQYTREATSSKLISQFLSELDGFSQNNSGVLVLASTNVPWALDSAFLRPGRFDRMVFVSPPDREARKSILQILLANRPVAKDMDVEFVAKNTSGFSGADLKNVVETAADEAIECSIREGSEMPISMAHMRQALQDVRPTISDWLSTARNYARYANESGQYNDILDFISKHGK